MMKYFLKALLVILLVSIGFSFYYFSNENNFLDVDPLYEETYFSNNFYYNTLNKKSKKYYSLLYDASLENKDNIVCHFKYIPDDFSCAVSAFIKDYPLNSYWIASSTIIQNYFMHRITMDFDDDLDTIAYNKKQIEEKAKEIIKQCKADNQYQTILNIHDYLLENITYNLNAKNAHYLSGALLYGEAVCDGYSSAFKYLMDLLNYECIVVHGKTNKSGESHAWNLVKIDDSWYGVDTTWDDTLEIQYLYFLTTDEILNLEHIADNNYEYPICEDASLFLIDDIYFVCIDNDYDEIRSFIKTGLKERYKDFYLFFKRADDCDQASEFLITNKKFIDIYKEVFTVNRTIYYGCDKSDNILHLYYHY